MFFEVWGGLGQVLARSCGVLGPSWRGLEAKMGAKMAPRSKILRSNFGLQFPMPFRMAYGELLCPTRGPRWRRWWWQAGGLGGLTDPDSGGFWKVISYAVHQSRTDAADPRALRAISATVPICCFVALTIGCGFLRFLCWIVSSGSI